MNWDSPGIFWDTGVRWDQPAFPISPRRTGMDILFKLKLDFVGWGESRFSTKAEFIVTSMTTEPMLTRVPDPFPAAVPARAAGTTALSDYKAAALLADDGSKAAIADRNQKRLILEGVLLDWAPYLELVAKNANDITILEQ